MENAKVITVNSGMNEIEINTRTIIYIKVSGGITYLHLFTGEIYATRTTLSEFERMLDSCFIKVRRGCLVSVYAIYSITDAVNLFNGETLRYSKRLRRTVIMNYRSKLRNIVHELAKSVSLKTEAAYRKHYHVFDDMPFAFTDIEMIFDEKCQAADWVFCYGNNALAKLEGISLSGLIGQQFGVIFPNMDEKWLRAYERVVFYGEVLNIVDYSPEIGANLNIICFPTFKGHCGCIMFDVDEMKFLRKSTPTDNAIAALIDKLLV